MDTPDPDLREEEPSAGAPSGATSPRRRAFAIALLLAGALAAGMGQTIVFSVLPPLAREIGISEFRVGLIFMVSAICWVFLGPRWGRASDGRGRKPFILTGLAGFAFSTAVFGASLKLGLAGLISGMPLYLLLVFTRALYGAIGSAGPPAAQAYIADRTSAEDRTAGMASFSAAFGLGAMLGPGFGAAAAVLGPVAPFFAMAGLAAAMATMVFFYLPERTQPTRRERRVNIKLTDPRLRPFLIFGVGFGVVNAIPIQTVGFYFIDRLGFSTEMAPQVVGVGLMAGAMASLFSQLVIVQRFRLPPRLLMRIAPALIVAGHALIWLTADLGPVIFGMMLGGFGAGLAIPGYNAAASLAVEADEQGAALGLSHSAGASGFIISPMVAFSLYAIAPQAPYILSMSLAAALWIFALTSRAVGEADPVRAAEIMAGQSQKPASSPYQ